MIPRWVFPTLWVLVVVLVLWAGSEAFGAPAKPDGLWYGQTIAVEQSDVGFVTVGKDDWQEAAPGRFTAGSGNALGDSFKQWTLTPNSGTGAGDNMSLLGGTACDGFTDSSEVTQAAYVTEAYYYYSASPPGGTFHNQYVVDQVLSWDVPTFAGLPAITFRSNRNTIMPGGMMARSTRGVFSSPPNTGTVQVSGSDDWSGAAANVFSARVSVWYTISRDNTQTTLWRVRRQAAISVKRSITTGYAFHDQTVQIDSYEVPTPPGMALSNLSGGSDVNGVKSYPGYFLNGMEAGIWNMAFTQSAQKRIMVRSLASANADDYSWMVINPVVDQWGNPLDADDDDGDSTAPPGHNPMPEEVNTSWSDWATNQVNKWVTDLGGLFAPLTIFGDFMGGD